MQTIGILKASSLVGTGKWQDRRHYWDHAAVRVNILIMHPELDYLRLPGSILQHPPFATWIFLFAFKQSLCWEQKAETQPPILLNETALLSKVLWASKELISDATVSAHRDLTLRFLYINKQQDMWVKTFHADGNVTRFPPYPGFNKTFPCNLR